MADAMTGLATLAVRVKRGAAVLDERRPEWAGAVALDRLAMDSCDRCVLGQLYGSYWEGVPALANALPRCFRFSSAEHGFTLFDREQDFRDEAGHIDVMDRFAALADLWRAEVRARTTEAPPCST
jgi:hypothetical protein